jgi:hypothetical protein
VSLGIGTAGAAVLQMLHHPLGSLAREPMHGALTPHPGEMGSYRLHRVPTGADVLCRVGTIEHAHRIGARNVHNTLHSLCPIRDGCHLTHLLHPSSMDLWHARLFTTRHSGEPRTGGEPVDQCVPLFLRVPIPARACARLPIPLRPPAPVLCPHASPADMLLLGRRNLLLDAFRVLFPFLSTRFSRLQRRASRTRVADAHPHHTHHQIRCWPTRHSECQSDHPFVRLGPDTNPRSERHDSSGLHALLPGNMVSHGWRNAMRSFPTHRAGSVDPFDVDRFFSRGLEPPAALASHDHVLSTRFPSGTALPLFLVPVRLGTPVDPFFSQSRPHSGHTLIHRLFDVTHRRWWMLLSLCFHPCPHHQPFALLVPLGISLGWSCSAQGTPLFGFLPSSLPPFPCMQHNEPHPAFIKRLINLQKYTILMA